MAAREFLLLQTFEHKQTPDGTIESVCVNCAQPVGSGDTINELAGREFLHTLLCLRRAKDSGLAA